MRYLTNPNLVEHGQDLFTFAQSDIARCSELFEYWLQSFGSVSATASELYNFDDNKDVSEDSVENMLKSLIDTCEGYIETFEFVIDLFLKVNLSQLRRDYLPHLKNEKTKVLRKKVLEKSKKKSKQFDMKCCWVDKSS